jgi:hypothetical protein
LIGRNVSPDRLACYAEMLKRRRRGLLRKLRDLTGEKSIVASLNRSADHD